MKALLCLATLGLVANLVPAAEKPSAETYFYDETTMRHLKLKSLDFGNVEVEVRFAAEPGGAGKWLGRGSKKDKDVVFARVVGEGEDQGTFFVAHVSESKVEIGYRPGQREPQDAGINGEYRRTSDAKRLQLAKKEFEAADERLVTSLKTGMKVRTGKDREAISLWRDQWPAMRERVMNITYTTGAGGVLGGPGTPAAAKPEAVKDPLYYLRLAEATARGYYFAEAMPDPKTGTGWDGEYDDFAGGHVSLRVMKDGRLRMTISFSRTEEVIVEAIEAVAPPDKVVTAKDGGMTAELTYRPLASEGEIQKPPMQVQLRKLGRYLEVKTEGAEKHALKGWFDGIYRGSPVPEQQ